MVLNVTGNNITQLEDFAGFELLHTLTATDNYISDLDSTSLVVRTLMNLEVLDLRNNPISKKPQFTERIVGYGVNIGQYMELIKTDLYIYVHEKYSYCSNTKRQRSIRNDSSFYQEICSSESL